MPSLAKPYSYGLLLCLILWPSFCAADEHYAAQIHKAELIHTGSNLQVQARIDYKLSPTAKEALHKGVPLTWLVLIQIREIDLLWDSTIYSQEQPYRLQFHALLSQYEVQTPDQDSEMFLTLNAALNFMSSLQNSNPIADDLLKAGRRYKLAIKCQFDRESLPVPLRPFAYLDAQWSLSSDWYLWPIQK